MHRSIARLYCTCIALDAIWSQNIRPLNSHISNSMHSKFQTFLYVRFYCLLAVWEFLRLTIVTQWILAIAVLNPPKLASFVEKTCFSALPQRKRLNKTENTGWMKNTLEHTYDRNVSTWPLIFWQNRLFVHRIMTRSQHWFLFSFVCL